MTLARKDFLNGIFFFLPLEIHVLKLCTFQKSTIFDTFFVVDWYHFNKIIIEAGKCLTFYIMYCQDNCLRN